MQALGKRSTLLSLRSDKEKQKLQAEVFELLAQIESSNKDKLIALKTVEKLEYTVHELNIRIEEITRTVTEVTAQRVRLSTENSELIKEIHEYKVSLDNVNHLKAQLAQQLEDTRHRLEDEERVCIVMFVASGQVIYWSTRNARRWRTTATLLRSNWNL